MGEPKCIYCGTSKDLSDSDIIPDALTASRIINKCVCHVEHNSGMTKKFESEVAEKLAFLLNYLNIKSKKSNHFPTYEADYVIAGIRYHDKKVVKEHDFINKKILWSENNECKRTIASTCSYASFSAIIVSHDTESKKLST